MLERNFNMTEKQKAEQLLGMVFKNSNEPYLKGGKRLVDEFDAKEFIVYLISEFELKKK
jgi:hypothetical protein